MAMDDTPAVHAGVTWTEHSRNSRVESDLVLVNGYLYVITNQGMPGLVKVGYCTTHPNTRAERMNDTNNPYPFVVDRFVESNDPEHHEKRAHENLKRHRVPRCYVKGVGVEWFECSTDIAYEAIRKAVAIDYETAPRGESWTVYDPVLKIKRRPNSARKSGGSANPNHRSDREAGVRAESKSNYEPRTQQTTYPGQAGRRPTRDDSLIYPVYFFGGIILMGLLLKACS